MALKTHRQGNDFKLTLQVYRLNDAISVTTDNVPDGAIPEDLTEAHNIKLSLYCSTGSCTVLKKTVNVNTIVAEIPTNIQDIGTYFVLLEYDLVDISFADGLKRITVDFDAFKIVCKSAYADTEGDMSLIGVIKVGLDGKSAYQYAQEHGYLGTDEEFGQLQYEATLAAVNEAERIIAESNREQTFNTQMDAVDTAIGLSDTATDNANLAATNANDKATLANNAATNADSKAQLAETATSNADIATGLANTATINANNAASNADAKASLADQKATLANDAAIAANTATGNANTATANANSAALAANSLAGTYNVTVAIPLGSGLYYNSTTARAAVPTANRLLGRVITYATASGVWVTEKFIGADVLNWTTEANWERVPDNSQLVQLGADFNTSIADEKAMFPAIAYNKRVLADSGTVISKQAVIDGYKTMIDLLTNTRLLFCPNAGVKIRTSGIYNYLTKAYDVGVNSIDLTQTTEGNQPYFSGNIAPNENKFLKSNINSVEKTINYTAVSFLNTDSFSFILSVKPNTVGSNQKINISSSSYITINSNGLTLYNGISNILSTSFILEVGKNSIVEFKYSNGTGLIKINGIPVTTMVISGAISFDRISTQATYFDGCIYYSQIFNKYLSEFESKNTYNYLRSQYQEIEGVNIGNQHWATSNYEGIVTGNGTIITEVQDAATWASLTTPAWCYYNNDPVLGSVYGKLYNWYAIQAIAANPPKGWRVPTYADLTQLSPYLGGDTVSGGKLKKEGFAYWASPNTGATNESGFSAIGSGWRNQSGFFNGLNQGMSMFDNYTINSHLKYLKYDANSFSSLANTPLFGASLRLLRNSPVGEQTQNISTGVFTTNITVGAANKDLNIPFGYEVKAINVMATTTITNFKCDLLNTSGVLQQNLVTGKSASANVPIKFGVSADANIQYTDPILRFNCTGNSGNGLEIQVILNKIL